MFWFLHCGVMEEREKAGLGKKQEKPDVDQAR
jgi:hypothetical protein